MRARHWLRGIFDSCDFTATASIPASCAALRSCFAEPVARTANHRTPGVVACGDVSQVLVAETRCTPSVHRAGSARWKTGCGSPMKPSSGPNGAGASVTGYVMADIDESSANKVAWREWVKECGPEYTAHSAT